MKIIDLSNKVIEIDNLSLAMMQADDYRNYRHTTAGFERSDERLRAYWEDMYQKLLKLQLQDDGKDQRRLRDVAP